MKRIAIVLTCFVTAAALAAGGYTLYRFGMTKGMGMSGTSQARDNGAASSNSGRVMKAGDTDPATGKKVLYWHDPMVPGRRFDEPGKSPFMNMMLVPVYEGDGDEGQVAVSARVQQNLGIRTAEVTRATITPQVEAVGSIAFNERDQVVVQARATAYVERLHTRATLDRVRKGQALVDLYVPEWVTAQEELLSLKRMSGTDLAVLVDAARQRMRQVGMSDEQIRLVEGGGEVQPRITLTAPIDGVIVELMVREGMTVMPGATLFRINGLATVWANADVPETQIALLPPGAAVQARSAAFPGSMFDGTVQAILPEVDRETRTIKARVELANPDGALAPGMFVTVALGANSAEGLFVPTEAVIQTGKRTVVMLAEQNGGFHPVDVELGIESEGQSEIKSGLEAGQRVVVSGQFLVDSEASLTATSLRMEDAQSMEHFGEGKIEAVSDETVTLSHTPIPSMQWGSMTMEFRKPADGAPQELEVGEAVKFAFTISDDGRPVLTRIEPAESVP